MQRFRIGEPSTYLSPPKSNISFLLFIIFAAKFAVVFVGYRLFGCLENIE